MESTTGVPVPGDKYRVPGERRWSIFPFSGFSVGEKEIGAGGLTGSRSFTII